MPADTTVTLAIGGLISGILAGFLGIGGGTVLVPLMVAVGFTSQQAVGTSSLAILVTALSGSIQNWRMGYLSLQRVILLGLPAIVSAQIGAFAANRMAEHVQLTAFGILLVSNVYLAGIRKKVTAQQRIKEAEMEPPPLADHPVDATAAAKGLPPKQPVGNQAASPRPLNPIAARVFTGGMAGLLAGLFGVGGGVIMVPLQILLLGEKIKTAVQTSLGVIVITAISASVGHALANNVVFSSGLILGAGGLVGVQISTRFLPKLSDRLVSFLFRSMLAVLSVYIFWQAWQSYVNQL